MISASFTYDGGRFSYRYQKVIDGYVDYPIRMPTKAVQLVGKLLEADTSKRFGNLVDGAQDIKSHSFFSSVSFDWDDTSRRGSYQPPLFDASQHEWRAAETSVVDRSPPPGDEGQKAFESFA